MHRHAPGRYVTSTTAGEPFLAFLPAPLPSVSLKFQPEGIRYDELSEDDNDEWDALEWDGDGTVPAS